MLINGKGAAFGAGDVGGGGSSTEDGAEYQVCLDTGVLDAYHCLQTYSFVVASFDLKWWKRI